MARPGPVRLDLLLVRRGLVSSRERARALIASGGVLVDGLVAAKPATRVRPDQGIELATEDFPWVGRGALKLLGVLEPFGIDPVGAVAADLGASTGGFTEVLLERGAVRVYAIDVGRGQLAWKLRTDERVVNMEGTNARYVETLPEPIDLIVGDLSFIGLALILPTVQRLLRPGGEAALLIKPQFEVGRAHVGKGGVVSSPEARQAAIDRVKHQAVASGLEVLNDHESPLPGARSGNIEHFLHLRRPEEAENADERHV